MRILSKKDDNIGSSTSFGLGEVINDEEEYSVNENKSV